jgi:hypothetical protein
MLERKTKQEQYKSMKEKVVEIRNMVKEFEKKQNEKETKK